MFARKLFIAGLCAALNPLLAAPSSVSPWPKRDQKICVFLENHGVVRGRAQSIVAEGKNHVSIIIQDTEKQFHTVKASLANIKIEVEKNPTFSRNEKVVFFAFPVLFESAEIYNVSAEFTDGNLLLYRANDAQKRLFLLNKHFVLKIPLEVKTASLSP